MLLLMFWETRSVENRVSRSSGYSVICFEKTEPSYLAGEAGLSVAQGSYQTVVNNLAQKLEMVYSAFLEKDRYQEMVDQSVECYQTHITWEEIANQLKASYHDK